MSNTVVIIEDHPTSADVAARQLASVGFSESHLAETAADGLALIEQVQPGLIVIDERLPDASGTELTRVIRQHQPGVTIIMSTVVDDEGMMQEAFAAGCNFYAVKPNGLRRLCAQRTSAAQLLDAGAQEIYR